MKLKLGVSLACALLSCSMAFGANKKIVLVAGKASHGPGDHEHRAGCLLLQQCLNKVPGVQVEVVTNGWPADTNIFNGAAAIVVYADGGEGHPFIQEDRLKVIGNAIKGKAGFGALHYGVEVPAEKGGKEFLEWSGGYFEAHWSVNPHWTAEFTKFPKHPIARGVKPFTIKDEWYYHMRFRENMKGVTAILTAVPPDETHDGNDGTHSGNPEVRSRKGVPEHMMWACERTDGQRGFGFTGAHFHKNWGNDEFRKTVLNAILWIAKVDVPKNGVESVVTPEDLTKNLDKK